MRATEVRIEVGTRLRSQQARLEEAIFGRLCKILAESAESQDSEYMVGLRSAVAAAVEYGLLGIENGEDWTGEVPLATVTQAHLAARSGVSLDKVLRRYAVGHTLLGDFVMAEADSFSTSELRSVLRTQGSLLDRLMVAIATEYMRELDRTSRSPAQHRLERIQKVLDDEANDLSSFEYDLNAWHLGMIVVGKGGQELIRETAAALDRQVLMVLRGEQTAWAWLRSYRGFIIADIEHLCRLLKDTDLHSAIGEPASGLSGWRLTHWQAQAALLVALRTSQTPTRYADVALLAATLKDDRLAASLRMIYLSPLDNRRNTGATLRKTLRAYFNAGCNAKAAAADLRVDRTTIHNRLRTIEDLLGSSIQRNRAELEVALRLESIDESRTCA